MGMAHRRIGGKHPDAGMVAGRCPSSRCEQHMPQLATPRSLDFLILKSPGSTAPTSGHGHLDALPRCSAPRRRSARARPAPTSTVTTCMWSVSGCGSQVCTCPTTTPSYGVAGLLDRLPRPCPSNRAGRKTPSISEGTVHILRQAISKILSYWFLPLHQACLIGQQERLARVYSAASTMGMRRGIVEWCSPSEFRSERKCPVGISAERGLSERLSATRKSRPRQSRRLKLPQEPHVAFQKHTQIRHVILQAGDALHPHAEREPASTPPGRCHDMDSTFGSTMPQPEDLEPAGALADAAALAVADAAAHVRPRPRAP